MIAKGVRAIGKSRFKKRNSPEEKTALPGSASRRGLREATRVRLGAAKALPAPSARARRLAPRVRQALWDDRRGQLHKASPTRDSPFNVVANSSTNSAILRDCALLTGWIAKKVAGSGSNGSSTVTSRPAVM